MNEGNEQVCRIRGLSVGCAGSRPTLVMVKQVSANLNQRWALLSHVSC